MSSIGLYVCGQYYSKVFEQIGMKFYGGVLGGINEELVIFWWCSKKHTHP